MPDKPKEIILIDLDDPLMQWLEEPETKDLMTQRLIAKFKEKKQKEGKQGEITE